MLVLLGGYLLHRQHQRALAAARNEERGTDEAAKAKPEAADPADEPESGSPRPALRVWPAASAAVGGALGHRSRAAAEGRDPVPQLRQRPELVLGEAREEVLPDDGQVGYHQRPVAVRVPSR